MSRQRILEDILAERERQDELWGGHHHDDDHRGATWISLIIRHLGLMVDDGDTNGLYEESDPERYRRQMTYVGAIVLAAIEASERKARAEIREEREVIPRVTHTRIAKSQELQELQDIVTPPVVQSTPVPRIQWANQIEMKPSKTSGVFWQELADLHQCVYILFDTKIDVLGHVDSCADYVVREDEVNSGRDAFLKNKSNQRGRITPTGWKE